MTTHAGRIDHLLRQAVEGGCVPGVVAMAERDGAPLCHAAFGRRSVDADAPMRADTVFWVASMAKAVTSVAALQLVDAGRIALDEPVGRAMPELAAPPVLAGFDASGAPVLRGAARPITLRHLLSHTAGFGEDVWAEPLARYARRTGLPSLRTGRREALAQPLLFDPGDAWQYGISHDWVGLVVERVGGLPLDRYLRQHVFDPLGMHDTGHAAPPPDRLAAVHRRDAGGALYPAVREVPARREYVPGGGSLFSTAPDYLRFLRMLLDGGRSPNGPLLRPDTAALMFRSHTGDLPTGVLRPARAELSHPVEFFAGLPKGWGFGGTVTLAPAPDGRGAGSFGWGGLGNTFFWADPGARVAAVLLTQILPFADPAVLALLAAFEALVYAG